MSDDVAPVDLAKLVSLCKRRGLVFQSSEIYGGLASTWDYGPLGIELKRSVKEAWWRDFVWGRDDIVGLDAAVLMHPDTWRASGHVESFADPLVECRECHQRWREDQLTDRHCPSCGGELTDARQFNLMFKTFMGPIEDEASMTYLRPETAQGIFVNFENVVAATRRKLPFGIAQIGKAFRNEITTGGFLFRTREFEMMEIEYFVKPGEDDESHVEWIEKCKQWYIDLGVSQDRLRVREHGAEELSHYSKATSDIEYRFPWGWAEIQGIANRTDYDLRAHADKSGQALTYFDDESGRHIVPYVIEPSAGVDRAVLTFLVDAYREEKAPTASGKLESRVVLKLHPRIAPVKVAVLPLSRNERLVPTAREVYRRLRGSGAIDGAVQYDDAQSIGRRYRRQDEVGTPLCVTVDFESIDPESESYGTVTIRDRDSMAQDRAPIDGLAQALAARLQVPLASS